MRFNSATRTLSFCWEAVATWPGSLGQTSVTSARSDPAIPSTSSTRVLIARSRSDGTTVR